MSGLPMIERLPMLSGADFEQIRTLAIRLYDTLYPEKVFRTLGRYQVLISKGLGAMFVARMDRDIVAYLWAETRLGVERWNVTELAELWVELEFRRMGVGRDLVNTAWEVCDPPFTVRVMAHMPEALEFWERMGFKPEYSQLRLNV